MAVHEQIQWSREKKMPQDKFPHRYPQVKEKRLSATGQFSVVGGKRFVNYTRISHSEHSDAKLVILRPISQASIASCLQIWKRQSSSRFFFAHCQRRSVTFKKTKGCGDRLARNSTEKSLCQKGSHVCSGVGRGFSLSSKVHGLQFSGSKRFLCHAQV